MTNKKDASRRPEGRRPGILVLLLLTLTAVLGARAGELSGTRSAPGDLGRADSYYAEKSYALALQLYENLAREGQLPPDRRDDVGLRIAVCLGRTRQWDRALDTTLAFLQEHRETLWEPRALVWSAALYEALPESAYRSGTRILFDGERSTAQQGGVPEHVYLREQIRRSRHEALEAARIFYQRYRGAAGLEAEQVQLNYALIRSLDEQSALARWGAGKEWLPPTDSLWRVDTSVPYDPGWPAPLQYLYLYRQIQDLAEQVEPGGRRGDLARLAEAVWLQRYHSWMNGVARRPIKEGDPPSEWRRIPYPYQDRDPLLLYRRVIEGKPGDSLSDQAWVQMAVGERGAADPPWAIAELQRFLAARPDSLWAPTARVSLLDLTRPGLSLSADHFRLAADRPLARITVRAVPEIRFRLYRARLQDVDWKYVSSPASGRGNTLLQPTTGPEPWYAELLAEWRQATRNPASFRYEQEEIPLPIRSPGAYVLEASGSGVLHRVIVTAGTLRVAPVADGTHIHFYAADTRSGKPLPGVEINAFEGWWDESRVQTPRGVGGRERRIHTNPEGTASLEWINPTGLPDQRMSVLARRGPEFFLIRGISRPVRYRSPSSNPEIRVHSVTDRPVYRPGQEVHLRHLVFEREQRGWRPSKDRPVRASVSAQDRSFSASYTGRTSPFGSFTGSVRLPADAPLGRYFLTLADLG